MYICICRCIYIWATPAAKNRIGFLTNGIAKHFRPRKCLAIFVLKPVRMQPKQKLLQALVGRIAVTWQTCLLPSLGIWDHGIVSPRYGAKLWLFCHILTNCNAQEGSKMVQIKPPTDRCQPDEVARRTIVWRCGNVHRRRQCFYMSNWPGGAPLSASAYNPLICHHMSIDVYVYIYMVKYSL